MSPKFYSYIWVLFFAAAALFWVLGQFTMLTLVVFGFCTFGLIFLGMLCVLPGMVTHSHEATAAKDSNSKGNKVARNPNRAVAGLRSA